MGPGSGDLTVDALGEFGGGPSVSPVSVFSWGRWEPRACGYLFIHTLIGPFCGCRELFGH